MSADDATERNRRLLSSFDQNQVLQGERCRESVRIRMVVGNDQDRALAAQPFDDLARELFRMAEIAIDRLTHLFHQTFKGDGNGRLRRFSSQRTFYLQAAGQDDHLLAKFQADGSFGQGSVFPFNRDEDIGGMCYDHVARMPHIRRHSDRDIRIRGKFISTGQDPEDLTASFAATFCGCVHHTAQPAACQDGTAPGNFAADGFGQNKTFR